MARLSSEQVLRDKNDGDPSSVTALNLSLRALTDVSCLSDFRNLGRLDVSCNGLTSLEGLSSCINLKWLSVAQNKLKSLRGIEGLSELTVLNACKNMLGSMNEVRSLTELRALILNDNEISSICNLDQLKYLNTLVLSRNPIHDIGSSLKKSSSISKLSLSKCKIQGIGSSLIFSLNLKELRLSDNEITSLPTELARNIKLQNLDLGKNLIMRLSDLKVLFELSNLKNLNLQGNPVAENPKLIKKIRKLVQNLQIFNAKPIERWTQNTDATMSGKKTKQRSDAGDAELKVEMKIKKPKVVSILTEKVIASINEDETFPFNANDAEKKAKKEKKTMKADSKPMEFDDGETSFMDLIFSEDAHGKQAGKPHGSQAAWDEKLLGGVIVDHSKKMKAKKSRRGPSALNPSFQVPDFGEGGPSTWDD